MRILIAILLFFSFSANGQTVTNQGSPLTTVRNLGKYQIDSLLRLMSLKNLNGDTYMLTTDTGGKVILRPVPSIGGGTDSSIYATKYYTLQNFIEFADSGQYVTLKRLADSTINLFAGSNITITGTFPNITISATSSFDTAAIYAAINSKQPKSDTGTTDATRYWVGQNYQPIGTYLTTVNLARSGLAVTNTAGTGFTLPDTPTTARKAQWDTAYARRIIGKSVTGTSTKTIRDTLGSGQIISATFTDQGITTETDPLSFHAIDSNTNKNATTKTYVDNLIAGIASYGFYPPLTVGAGVGVTNIGVDTVTSAGVATQSDLTNAGLAQTLQTITNNGASTTNLVDLNGGAKVNGQFLYNNAIGTRVYALVPKMNGNNDTAFFPAGTDTVVMRTATQILTNKTLDNPKLINIASTANNDSLLLIKDGTVERHIFPSALPPNGSAGGDLTGSYPTPQIASGVIVDADINASAAIAVSKLAASTISGVTLGDNLKSLTIGSSLSGTSYNGSGPVTINVSDADKGDITVATSGTAWTIDAGTITAAKMASQTSTEVAGWISDETGSSGGFVRANSPTIVTPTIANFGSAQHNHTNAAGGGQLTDAALSSQVTVAKGGTGNVSATAYAIIAGGTTTTGAFQSIPVGIAGQPLVSGGASALPTYTNRIPEVHQSGNINMLSTGATAVFTTDPSRGKFVVTGCVAYVTSVTGTPTGTATANVVFGASVISAFSVGAANASAVDKKTVGTIANGLLLVPASTSISVNVTAAFTVATVINMQYDITGYYNN